jgi:ABC-type multidrug transport system permease subunit
MASIALVALIYGVTYIGQGKLPAEGGTTANIQNIVGLMYSSSLFTGVLNCNLVLPVQMNEREVFYRESKTLYGTLHYGLASLTRELPYLAAQAAVFVTVVYWMAGFVSDSAEAYLLFALTVFLVMLTFTVFGQLLAVLTPSRPVAQVVFSFVITFWNAFAGFAIPVTSMSPVVAWIWWICPTSWSLYALASSQLGDSTAPILPAGGGTTVPANIYLEERFGYRYDFRWWALLILLSFTVVFSALFLVALRFVNWQLR